MEVHFMIDFDKRSEEQEDPLIFVIQTLWDHHGGHVSRYARTTLEFRLFGATHDDIDNTASDLAAALSKKVILRMAKVEHIIGLGDESLNTSLAEFIRENKKLGRLKMPY